MLTTVLTLARVARYTGPTRTGAPAPVARALQDNGCRRR
jgi:hypothetical protein